MKNDSKRKGREKIQVGQEKLLGYGIFKDSNNRAMTSVRDRRTKWDIQLQGGEGQKEFDFFNFLRGKDNLCVFTQVFPQALSCTAITE